MRLFGEGIGIVVGDSSSLASGSISLNQPLPGINFVYFDSRYSSSISTGSIGSLETTITTASEAGVRGELLFRVKNFDNPIETGSVILKLSHTGSNDEPRVGIGFSSNETVEKTFEIKSKKDSADGTDLVLEGSRVTTGASIGDEAGKIDFVINSGSFNNNFTSGSIAHVKAVVKEVSNIGAQGRIVMSVGKAGIEEPTNFWSLAYGDGTTGGELPSNLGTAMVLSGSVQLVDFTSGLESSYSLLDSDNTPTFVVKNVNGTQGTASLYLAGPLTGSDITTNTISNIEVTLSDDGITNVDTFATATYKGAIYDYILYDAGVGARTGLCSY